MANNINLNHRDAFDDVESALVHILDQTDVMRLINVIPPTVESQAAMGKSIEIIRDVIYRLAKRDSERSEAAACDAELRRSLPYRYFQADDTP